MTDDITPAAASAPPDGAAPAPANGSAAVPLAELAALLRAYDESTAALQATHGRLQREVERLSGELQRKNEALTASLAEVSTLKDYLADIIDNDAGGVVALDADGRVIAFNPAAREILAAAGADWPSDSGASIPPASPTGLPGGSGPGPGAADAANPLVGRDWRAAFPDPARPLGELLARALAERRRILGVELVLGRPEADGGGVRHITASVAPVLGGRHGGAPGELTGAVGAFQDMTDYRLLAERAKRHERLAALGEMAAGVAHEIRNPLGGIELYASNLARQLPEGPQRATCEKIIAATTRLNRIVTDLLSFTRSREPARRPARVEAMVRQALDAAAPSLAAKAIAVSVDCAGAPGRYALDPDLLGQAFLNVIQNAVQAMSAGGRLSVTAREADEDGEEGGGRRRVLSVSFADDGPGIPASAREKLFNPFYTTRAEGTGLGLAITHKIAQDHGGGVVVGEATPRGAVFTFRLPVRLEEGG